MDSYPLPSSALSSPMSQTDKHFNHGICQLNQSAYSNAGNGREGVTALSQIVAPAASQVYSVCSKSSFPLVNPPRRALWQWISLVPCEAIQKLRQQKAEIPEEAIMAETGRPFRNPIWTMLAELFRRPWFTDLGRARSRGRAGSRLRSGRSRGKVGCDRRR